MKWTFEYEQKAHIALINLRVALSAQAESMP